MVASADLNWTMPVYESLPVKVISPSPVIGGFSQITDQVNLLLLRLKFVFLHACDGSPAACGASAQFSFMQCFIVIGGTCTVVPGTSAWVICSQRMPFSCAHTPAGARTRHNRAVVTARRRAFEWGMC